MRQSMKVALFGVLSLVMAQAVQANEQHQGMAMSGSETSAQPQVVSASGVVKEIDLKNKKITIAHEAIPAIGWPAMTMRFTFATQDDSISALKPGSQVNFSFIQQGNISLLQSINVIPS
ncbi:cation efflux system protein CusF [[Enterobacter] lignolyticus]|uniref:Cu(I)/Ag(I) efflux system periplasmic protein CusF n=2 Tax=[Enterobacter] lignolyticus TaxID=1334193 RepID=E3G5H2_ENTLS|nr:cation efflux system protein CusF [[Enterobacter] lignolyticus]ADO49497.1 Cu(I)/Ag(I) efflux system periplasmic protein CusF [[Enterobacter] lignolyticus SCF1]ALR75868.1 copper ABC transporter substrate-binding protein [[Enterobacter] lignolyticus]